jgi:hypothetical protein
VRSSADQAYGPQMLFRPRARMARVIPARMIVFTALVLVAIVASLCFVAALFGYRDGYTQGFRAGVQAHREIGDKP